MFVAIIPAYNEEKYITSVVKGVLPHVDRVVVVDDGSTDATANEARFAGAVVLRHALNRGQGAALETGHEYARSVGAEYVLHFDADAQMSPDDIMPAFEAMRTAGADVVFGSRFLGGNITSIPWFKKNILLPLARIVSRIFGAPALTDAHNGFRILNRRALERIRITHDRMAHATEIPAIAARAELRSIEHPVRVEYREYGQSAFDGFDVVKDLMMGKIL